MNNKQIAEAFSKHQFESTFPFISENIVWNMVGAKVTEGKSAVISSCEESSSYLKNVKTSFLKFLVLDSNDYVTIDSISEYVDQEKNISKVASCDIYSFQHGQLTEITSYCVELAPQ